MIWRLLKGGGGCSKGRLCECVPVCPLPLIPCPRQSTTNRWYLPCPGKENLLVSKTIFPRNSVFTVLRNVHLKLIVRHLRSLNPPYLIMIFPRGRKMAGIYGDVRSKLSHVVSYLSPGWVCAVGSTRHRAWTDTNIFLLKSVYL